MIVRSLLLSLFLVLAVILGLGVRPSVAGESVRPRPITSNLIIPLDGDTPAGDDVVHVSGRVRILSRVIKGETSTNINLRINLQDVSGIGNPSGNTYIGTGDYTINYPPQPISPTDPILPPIITTFLLRQVDSLHPSDPMFVMFSLSFNPDSGKLTGASAVILPPNCF